MKKRSFLKKDYRRKVYPHKHRVAVYFLWDGDKVVYVGASRDLQWRIYKHKSLKRITFTDMSFIELRPAKLRSIEQFFIRRLRPKYNKVGYGPKKKIKKILVQL